MCMCAAGHCHRSLRTSYCNACLNSVAMSSSAHAHARRAYASAVSAGRPVVRILRTCEVNEAKKSKSERAAGLRTGRRLSTSAEAVPAQLPVHGGSPHPIVWMQQKKLPAKTKRNCVRQHVTHPMNQMNEKVEFDIDLGT